jgi:hypothetical protein
VLSVTLRLAETVHIIVDFQQADDDVAVLVPFIATEKLW